MNFAGLTEKIENSEIITIFRHVHPDCDALGSQFGLREWIRDNYPGKQVYAIGTETCSQGRFPASDEVSDEVIAQSLAIVTDTAGLNRVDDRRAMLARDMVKIDHHPNLEPYGNPCIVNDKAAAACEIVTEYLRSMPESKVSLQTAEYLYQGLLTDTLRFSTSNTTSDTLMNAAYLASSGVDIPVINRVLFDRSVEEFQFAGMIRSSVKMADPHTAYVILTCEKLRKWNMSASDARNYVSELGSVREFSTWAIFTETEPGIYAASLRSKTAAVNEIAVQYRGGGHKNAAGIKNLSRHDVEEIIEKLKTCE